MKERKDLAKTYALMQTIKDPLYKNFIEGKLVEVSKKDWNKKSGIEDNLKVALFSAKYSEYLQQQNK